MRSFDWSSISRVFCSAAVRVVSATEKASRNQDADDNMVTSFVRKGISLDTAVAASTFLKVVVT
jgi:hypothetical protein